MISSDRETTRGRREAGHDLVDALLDPRQRRQQEQREDQDGERLEDAADDRRPDAEDTAEDLAEEVAVGELLLNSAWILSTTP